MRQKPSVVEGFTLVELLVAMFIFGIVLTLVGNLMMDMLRGQGNINSEVQVQTNLRRASEILSQDVRNAVFGMITGSPYASNSIGFSVAHPVSTAVYPVTEGGTTFRTSTNVSAFVPAGFNWLQGTSFILVDPSRKQGTVLQTSQNLNTSVAGTATVQHASQINTLCNSQAAIIQAVTQVGYQYDAANKVLYRSVSAGTGWNTAPLLFGVTRFQVNYVGVNNSSYSSVADLIAANTELRRIVLSVGMQTENLGQSSDGQLNTSIDLPKVFTLTNSPLNYVAPGTPLTC